MRCTATILCVALCVAFAVPRGVPRCEDARAQIEYAAKRKLELRGKKDQERKDARMRAVEAYRAVHRYHPRALAERAEASFRAGELLRAGRLPNEARECFEEATRLGKGTEFRARAWLEIGHGYRRGYRLVDALAAYQRVAIDEEAAPRHRDAAMLWRARLHARLDRDREACAAWEHVAREGFDPFDRLEAFDEWALHLIDEGDLEGATGVLNLCDELMAQRLAEETRTGRRLRRTKARMRAYPRLEAAIEARRKLREAEGEERRRSLRRALELPARHPYAPHRRAQATSRHGFEERL